MHNSLQFGCFGAIATGSVYVAIVDGIRIHITLGVLLAASRYPGTYIANY